MVARINDVIAVLDRRRQVLVEKRAAALQNIDRYKVALAPHRKLPKEILGQIFKQCAMGREAPPYFARLYPRSLVVIFPWL
ncbi:hypothetical protein AMATHDRAFT_147703 [Amanita thiersii Skay4041]|uniref:Chorismate mutase domain-containing protein n=1 Tax=Amanita thiersii Skay4041 TaxID=703135 RepID=A0A2A9NMD1_9AGAR|nr:hypothetical protein AMATHDRAFT_147703 [Amanita thiersii Skay4041]